MNLDTWYTQKLALFKEILTVTQQALLLVDLEKLDPLLERKDALIEQITALDERMDSSPGAASQQGVKPGGLANAQPAELSVEKQARIAQVVETILENERTLELRIHQEQDKLRRELRDLDQETQVRRYLEQGGRKSGMVSIKK